MRDSTSNDPLWFLDGASGMAGAIHAFDWSSTPLGPITAWPQWLVTTVANLAACRQPMAVWIGSELTTIFNDGFAPILGGRAADALGRPVQAVWFDVWSDIEPLFERTLAGESLWFEDMPLLMTRNGFAERTHWTFSYSPVRDGEGTIVGLLDTVTETTTAVNAQVERREAEERQRNLQHELAHRMKNTLAMVQAIVSQSLRHAVDKSEAAMMASARIQALGRAQDTLTSTNWTASGIEEVVRASIAPHLDGGARFDASGPALDLDAQKALGLALAIHELATNATKHGALSNATGTVTISWNLSAQDEFTFAWIERGGPPVGKPTRRGFGSRLMESVVPGYFGGRAVTSYEATGLRYVLEAPFPAARPRDSRA